jgi:hypothetical protein
MASHAIFQYNVLAIDDIHNTWTNMIIKMTILRLLGSSDDKKKIGVARPEGPPLRLADGGRGGAAPRRSQGSALKTLRFRSTGRTDARASEHPVVVGRTDAMILWCRRESKPSQPISIG